MRFYMIEENLLKNELGNYPGFITLLSHESSVTFILRKVKAKVFGGSLEKRNVCPEIMVSMPGSWSIWIPD